MSEIEWKVELYHTDKNDLVASFTLTEQQAHALGAHSDGAMYAVDAFVGAQQKDPTNPDRTVAGQLWLELINRWFGSLRQNDEARTKELLALADGIEKEFPEQVAAERALWKGKPA